jgi:SAM-dependent methyltransferase
MTERVGPSYMETFISTVKTSEQARQEKGLKLISQEKVDERIGIQYAKILKDQAEDYVSFSRGAEEYLDDKSNYAMLPGYKGFSARQLIKNLPEGSALLDVACGNARFLYEVKYSTSFSEPVNEIINVYGYDGLKRDMRIGDEYFVEGNLTDLTPEKFGGMKFDIVTNSATSYHVEDFFGRGLQAMTSMLKLDGLLLVSSLPRAVRMDLYDCADECGEVIVDETLIEDRNGEIMQGVTEPINFQDNYIRSEVAWRFAKCAGVFRPDGSLVTPKDYFSFLQEESDGGFSFEYSVTERKNDEPSKIDGKLTVRKLREDAELNLGNVFYATMDIEEMLGTPIYQSRLSYIIAKTQEEAEELRNNGFVSVGDNSVRNRG